MDMRLFIALELDHAGKRAVGKLIDRIGRPPGKFRFVTPAQMHLTLNFLGSLPAERASEISDAMIRAAATVQPFEFALAGFGGFPDLRSPRVLWVGLNEPAGALLRLQSALTRELAALGFRPEGRAFTPHITLARVKFLERRVDYEAMFKPLTNFSGPDQSADEILLISSDLSGDIPVYTTVATVPLGGS
ncbi:MAG: RNA 2',3'-cyclic phosphodiesterase [Phycisphaerae bacterium]|nr:RNA 2',3'-cyclic phosphodiesterase [Phycisphaerae bacterium]